MNIKVFCTAWLCSILLAACGSAANTPTASPTVAPTAPPAVAQPQITVLITPSLPSDPGSSPSPVAPASEPTAAATLQTTILPSDESFLLYQTQQGLKVSRADGTFTTLVHTTLTPTLGRNLSAGIRPHDMSVAIYNDDNPMTPDREGAGPLTLSLLDVPTGNSKAVTPLFSTDMAQAIMTATTTGDRTAEVEAGIAVVENDHTLAWSPDGRYLAFIAAIDGPSSDLYSYDRETGQVNRLTDGANQAARVFWSPDSQWIVHEEVESFGTGAGWNVKAVWAAAPDGSGNRKLYDTEHSGDEVFVAWVSPEKFLVYSWTVMGLQNIRLVNLHTGEAQRIGPEFPVQALAFDPKSQTQLMAVDRGMTAQNNIPSGLYLASQGSQPQLIVPGNWYDARWLPHAQLFFAKGEQGVISVALDGTNKPYPAENSLPIDSPDGAWLLAWGDGNFTSPIGLRLYTAGELKRTLTSDAVTFATWSPHADGVFYVSDGRLYYVSVPNGEPQLIEKNMAMTEAGSLGWVTP